jgi:hypothetical protein
MIETFLKTFTYDQLVIKMKKIYKINLRNELKFLFSKVLA